MYNFVAKYNMAMFRRLQADILKSRMAEPRDRIQAIAGPRQVGKSTMVKQVVQESSIPAMLVSADNVPPSNTAWIADVWATARARLKASGAQEFMLVIDEVHKIANWSEAVKQEWDADTLNDVNIKVVVLGSSRLLLKDGLTESLAGRYELIRMPHWSYAEMRNAFGLSLEQYVFFGGYPGGANYVGDERRWRRYIKDSIVAPALERDVLRTKTLYKPALIKQLFELGCTYSGEELSLNKMLGQLQDAGNVTTLASYLSVLDEARMLSAMQKYAADDARKYNSVPKLMAYNTALLTALSGASYMQTYTTPKQWGRWVESAVGAHLLNMADEHDYKVHYWRERNAEVDFVLSRGHRCVAIEVKSGRRATNQGLGVFRERYNPEQSFVVGTGGIPVEEFLMSDLSFLFS